MTLLSSPPRRKFSDLLALLDVDRTERGDFIAHCPAHTDSSASLVIGYNADKRKATFTCRAGCGGEDILSALSLTWSDVYDLEPGDDVVTMSPEPSSELGVGDRAALAWYLDRSRTVDTAPAREYAARRFGIDDATFERLGLGYDDGTLDGGNLVLSPSKFHDAPRLLVPMVDFEGRPGYVQGRALTDGADVRWSGPNNPTGSRWSSYGVLTAETGWNEVLITEGPSDALAAVAAGYDAVLVRGAGLATNATLQREIAENLRDRRVIVAGDTDDAGQRFSRTVAEALAGHGLSVAILQIPAEVSDLAEWREKRGSRDFPDALIRGVKAARAVVAATPARPGTPSLTDLDADVLTDVERAALVYGYIQSRGMDVAYVRGLGWHLWQGTTWEPTEEDAIRDLAHQTGGVVRDLATAARRDAAAAEGSSDYEAKVARAKAIADCASMLLSTRGVANLLVALRSRSDVRATSDQFDQQKDVLGVANGIVCLRTGELRPWTKADRLTRRLSIDYVPDQPDGLWAQFLSDVFIHENGTPSPEYVAYMQRLLGYGVTGESREHIFPVLYGEGRNGKSRFLEALKGTFREISRTTPMETFTQTTGGGATPDLIPLRWARLVLASESGADHKFDEGRIKSITGGEEISARALYQDPIEFAPQFLILAASNHRPTFRGTDNGLWRRVRLLGFHATFEEGSAKDDVHIDEKLAALEVQREILRWSIDGAKAWYAGGLQTPAFILAATADYRVEQDRTAEFFASCVEITGDSGDVVKGTDLFTTYADWADSIREKHPLGRNAFLARVRQEKGIRPLTRSKQQWFRGVKILDSARRQQRAVLEASEVGGTLLDPSDTPFAI